MFKAFTFIYDGVSSSNYNLKLLRIDDKDAYAVSNGVPSKSYTMCKTNNSSKQEIVGVTVEDTLEFNVQILFDWEEDSNPDGISRNYIGKIRKWLFNQTDFKKLIILQPDMSDVYYEAIFTENEDLMLEGDIIGFSGKVKCNNTGAYKTKTYKKKCSEKTSFSIINDSDGIFDIPLFTEISLGSSTTGVDITINGETTSITGVTGGTNITLDSDTLETTATNLVDLYNGSFNLVFPMLKSGLNKVTIDTQGEVTVKFKWNPIMEVGV